VVRGGREIKLPVTLETAPDQPRDEILIRSRSPFLGATVANLSPALADELRLDSSSSEGVVIVDVEEGTLARSLGFQRGDIVVAVNNRKIDNTRELDRITSAGSRQWRVTIVRGGQQISAVFGG
jgi:S1-C subfamily serine protease